MASTYNYQTGEMKFDFVVRKDGLLCNRGIGPVIPIGSGACRKCC